MKFGIKAGAVLLGAAAALAAQAQDNNAYSVKLPPGVKVGDVVPPAATAGASLGSPIGFGASWGNAGVGLYTQTFDGPQVQDDVDGGAGFAIGFGNAKKAVGLEVGLALSSLWGGSNAGGSFGENGSFGAKLHTQLPGAASIAVGATGFGRFGNSNDARATSLYVAGTKVSRLGKYALATNLGFGNKEFAGKFTNDDDGLAAFGSLAFYFNPQVSLIADYTGRFLNAGVSVAPLRKYPLTLSLAAINTTGRYDGHAEAAVSVGYGFRF